MIVILKNPTPDNTCAMCAPFIGFVFDSENALPLPAHPRCDCYYQPDIDDQPITQWTWSDVSAECRHMWTRHLAWRIRTNEPIPPILEPLRDSAETHNRTRKQKDLTMPYALNNYAPPARVDRIQGIIFGVSIIQAVEALGHDAIVDQTAVNQITTLGHYQLQGVKSRFTHPGLSADGTGKYLGRLLNFRTEGTKSKADLHLAEAASKSPEGDLREYVLSLAEEDPAAFGLSIHADGGKIWQLPSGEELDATQHPRPDNATTKKPLFRFTQLHAVDVVDEPAANRDGLFGHSTNAIAARVFDQLDAFVGRTGLSAESLPALIHQLYSGTLPADHPIHHELGRARRLYALSRTDSPADDIPQAYALSFIHRYVQARTHARPSSSTPAPKGDNPMPKNSPISAETHPTDPTPTEPALTAAEDWVDLLSITTINAMLDNCDLPAPTINRLRKGTYPDAAALKAAISDARAEHDELDNAVVTLNGQPPRDPISVESRLDEARQHVDWFFGASSQTPPANYRRFDQLYIALTGDTEFRGIFDPENVMLAGATTANLSGWAADAMNKVIALQFSALTHWRWYEKIAAPVANDGTVHDMKFVTFGGVGDLPVVAEGGSYTELDVDDTTESASFIKKGGYVGITLEMIRNSNIAQIQAVPKALAIAALRTRSAAISALFTANSGIGPTLADGNALFHATRNNIDTVAFSTTNWRAARTECFSHAEVNSGKALAVFPKFCLVPVDLYDTALTTFGYGDGQPTTYTPEAEGRGAEDPRPVPLAVPDWSDANDWAYVVDPKIFPVIQMSYAQSPGGGAHPRPELFTVTSPTSGLLFTNDTLPIKVRDWFAAGVNGGRGIGKRNVA